MNFLAVNRFYGDEQVPTGRMLRDLALCLAEDGHNVTILVSSDTYVHKPNSFDEEHGISVRYLRGSSNCGRFLSWAIYWIRAVLIIPFMNWDRCIILTDPPFLVLIAPVIKLFFRKRRLYWWTMDLYPEALVSAGIISPKGMLNRVLRQANEIGMSNLDGLITLGEMQLLRLSHYSAFRKLEKLSLVVSPWDNRHLFCDATKVSQLKQKFGLEKKRVILYAGNLGYGHSYEDAVSAASISYLRDEDWIFAFFCRGAKVEMLRKLTIGLPNVIISDYLPPEETAALLHLANFHLITMEDGWEGVVVPSKLYGVLQTKAPILFIGPTKSDTAQQVQLMKAGISLPNGCGGDAIMAAINMHWNKPPARFAELNETYGPKLVANFISA